MKKMCTTEKRWVRYCMVGKDLGPVVEKWKLPTVKLM
jgi:hypothetical protein